MSGTFGLAYIKREGGGIHPDDDCWDADYVMSDERYVKQGAAYLRDSDDDADKINWSRPHLLPKIKAAI